ncbi:MAG: hypothetical protein ACI88C_002502 [Acidimicrobiales bacterium]|jgi:hypothetical protein
MFPGSLAGAHGRHRPESQSGEVSSNDGDAAPPKISSVIVALLRPVESFQPSRGSSSAEWTHRARPGNGRHHGRLVRSGVCRSANLSRLHRSSFVCRRSQHMGACRSRICRAAHKNGDVELRSSPRNFIVLGTHGLVQSS